MRRKPKIKRMRRTRVNTGRKRSSRSTAWRSIGNLHGRVITLEASVRTLRMRAGLTPEPGLFESLTAITPFPEKYVAPTMVHEWVIDKVPYAAGWWWRKPLGWLLKWRKK